MSTTGTEALRPSPLKWLAMIAISAALVWMGSTVASKHPAVAWSCMVFFALCGVVGVVNLLPNASRLVLDDDGFEIRSLFRASRVRWADVARFGTMRIGLNTMVGFDFVAGYRGNDRLRRINRGLSGFQGALPDTYGMKAAALADRMEARLAAYRPGDSLLPSTGDAPAPAKAGVPGRGG
ncbi:MAG: PH domain-containing protein [Luteimonas sp.]|nr:PH domain-containing protein [Luteimonas sp.]